MTRVIGDAKPDERLTGTNLLNLFNGGVLEFDHGGGSGQSCNRQTAGS